MLDFLQVLSKMRKPVACCSSQLGTPIGITVVCSINLLPGKEVEWDFQVFKAKFNFRFLIIVLWDQLSCPVKHMVRLQLGTLAEQNEVHSPGL
jgi:hypothetical protein